jgi:hypothetical protein
MKTKIKPILEDELKIKALRDDQSITMGSRCGQNEGNCVATSSR